MHFITSVFLYLLKTSMNILFRFAMKQLNSISESSNIIINIEGHTADVFTLSQDTSVLVNSIIIRGPRDGGSTGLPTLVIPGSVERISRKELNITDLNIRGNISTSCGGQTFRLHLENVIIGDLNFTSVIHFWDCTAFYFGLVDSLLLRSLVRFDASESTLLVMTNTTILGLNSSLTTEDTGVHIAVTREGKHVFELTNSTFKNLYHNLGTEKPSAAFALSVEKSGSQVKLTIDGCYFFSNHRAIDLSLYGTSEIYIVDTNFTNNIANGSGGAVRFTQTRGTGLGAFTELQPTRIHIGSTVFLNNMASGPANYSESDVYYQTRSPPSGGAIYVFLNAAKSYDHKAGIVWVTGCTFSNNSAQIQGGTLFVNPGISTLVNDSTMVTAHSEHIRPKFGSAIYGSCNMTLQNVRMQVDYTDGHTSILSYQASDPSSARLLALDFSMECPIGHWAEQLNTSSLVADGGIEELQLFCRACSLGQYSLSKSTIQVRELLNYTDCVNL